MKKINVILSLILIANTTFSMHLPQLRRYLTRAKKAPVRRQVPVKRYSLKMPVEKTTITPIRQPTVKYPAQFFATSPTIWEKLQGWWYGKTKFEQIKLKQLVNAVKADKIKTVQELLTAKNINHRFVGKYSVKETTLLHYAIKKRSLNTAKYLVDMGAKINAQDHNGRTPLFEAILISESRFSRLFYARLLIEKGADVNTQDKDGMTPLHEACRRGYLDLIKLFIENGAEVNRKNKKGRTPLHDAVLHYRTQQQMNPELSYPLEDIKFLIQNGAKIGETDEKGFTPLNLVEKLPYDEAWKNQMKALLSF